VLLALATTDAEAKSSVAKKIFKLQQKMKTWVCDSVDLVTQRTTTKKFESTRQQLQELFAAQYRTFTVTLSAAQAEDIEVNKNCKGPTALAAFAGVTNPQTTVVKALNLGTVSYYRFVVRQCKLSGSISANDATACAKLQSCSDATVNPREYFDFKFCLIGSPSPTPQPSARPTTSPTEGLVLIPSALTAQAASVLIVEPQVNTLKLDAEGDFFGGATLNGFTGNTVVCPYTNLQAQATMSVGLAGGFFRLPAQAGVLKICSTVSDAFIPTTAVAFGFPSGECIRDTDARVVATSPIPACGGGILENFYRIALPTFTGPDSFRVLYIGDTSIPGDLAKRASTITTVFYEASYEVTQTAAPTTAAPTFSPTPSPPSPSFPDFGPLY